MIPIKDKYKNSFFFFFFFFFFLSFQGGQFWGFSLANLGSPSKSKVFLKIKSHKTSTHDWKAWTAIDRLSIIWKFKMKRSFFQAAVVSILLYGCTTWTLTKRLERRLDGNYTRMLRAVLNKSWRQHPTRLQLYGHLPPITKTIQVRRTRHAGHCWRSKDELKRCTPVDPHSWMCKSGTTSTNLHTAAM